MKIHTKVLVIFAVGIVLMFAMMLGLSFGIGSSSRILITVLTLAGGILFFFAWYGLDQAVLSPIRSLTRKVESAAAEGRLPVAIGAPGHDEISVLSREIETLAHSLAQVQARYSNIVDTQSNLICCYGADGRISFVNRAMCDFLARPREKLLGSDVGALFPGSYGAPSPLGRCELMPSAPVILGQEQFVSPDGTRRWLRREDHGTFDAAGNLVEVQTVLTDVTESHLARLRVEESETRYRKLFENAHDGIMIVDEETGGVCDANLSLCRMLGRERSALLGRNVESLVVFPSAEDHTADDDEGRPHPKALKLSALELRRGDKEQVFCDIIITPYQSETRRLEQWNFRDITDRKKADDGLRQLSGQLLSLQDQERRRISRELHDSTAQVLAAVQMNLSILSTIHEESDPTAQQLLRETRSMVNQCNDEIRTLSYLLHPPLLDEVGLVFAIKLFVDGFSKRSGLKVSVVVPETIPRLPSDVETTFFRVVQEALSNVHRHSGGTQAWIRIERTADGLMVEVRDNGRGISADRQARLDVLVPSLGVGLRGMRERLAHLHGDLKVLADIGGTRVRANVTLNWEEICPALKS